MRTIHLIRHAKAEPRSGWSGPDLLRPLSTRGLQQAEQIAEALGGLPIVQVRTSPALRCTQTVKPLCEQLDIDPIIDEQLAEGHAIALPQRQGVHVLCAHGDNIPALLESLGVECGAWRKGSIWTLDFTGPKLTASRYTELDE